MRYSFSINNIAEMVCGQDGVPLYLVSRGKNQFLTHRELFLGCQLLVIVLKVVFHQDSFKEICTPHHQPRGLLAAASPGLALDQVTGGCHRLLGYILDLFGTNFIVKQRQTYSQYFLDLKAI